MNEVDKKLISTLQEWMSQSDPDAWLLAHPEHMESLSPYQNLDSVLQSSAREHCQTSEPSSAAFAAGHTRLMAEVQGMAKPAGFRQWSAPARAGAMAAVTVAALTMAAGASAAFGGGDLGQAVLDAVTGPSDHEEGINNAPPKADNGREHANENAFEGSGNADDKSLNGVCQTEDEDAEVNPNANPNAAERCDNADNGIGNAGEIPGAGADHAADQASQGSGNADTHPTPPPQPDVPADPPGSGGR